MQYFGGKTNLRRVTADEDVNWPLPPSATGTARPWLVADKDGLLFLFNEPGRLLRIRPTPKAAEPFKIEATFSHKIPNVEPNRFWMDPGGRLIIAHGDHELAICFPGGVVPPTMAEKMPAAERDDDDDAADK